MTKERPILFSAPMVRAILDGRKAQTRRIVNRVHGIGLITDFQRSDTTGYDWIMRDKRIRDKRMRWNDLKNAELLERCPYGKTGDKLWVRETHWVDKRDNLCAVMDLDGFAVDIHQAGKNQFVKDFDSLKNNKFWKKRPSIHMPRLASRILLEITGVRTLVIDPDLQADFTALPFSDNSFALVIFDPPHLIRNGTKGWLAKKYGKLGADWREEITKGFAEGFRVLKPEGVLIFKWNEHEIPVSQILKLTPVKPLFGNRCGKTAKSHWIVFMKTENS